MLIEIISHEDFQELLTRIDAIQKKLDALNGTNVLTQKLYSVNEACHLLKVSRRTLQRYRDNGLLSFTQVKNKIMFQKDDIEQFIKSNKVKAFICR
jgi:excisionase family DNA binding protein